MATPTPTTRTTMAPAASAGGGGGDGKAEEHQGDDYEAEEEEDVEERADDRPQRVDDGLFIGACDAALDLPALQSRNITHVLHAADGLPPPAHPLTLQYLVLRIADREDEDVVARLPEAFAFIDAARSSGGAALVVCAAGVSRSASVCLAYVMRTRGWSFDRALAALRDVRPWVAPNAGFEAQLRRFGASGCDAARGGAGGGGVERRRRQGAEEEEEG